MFLIISVARRSSIEQQTVQPTAKKENGNVWKHAAGEIVDMFNKIRAEGNDSEFAILMLYHCALYKNTEAGRSIIIALELANKKQDFHDA